MSFARSSIRHLRPLVTPCRSFSSAPALHMPRIRPSKTLKAQQSKPLSPRTRPYNRDEVEALQEYYSPEQIKGLLAGEKSIDRRDFDSRVHRRQDPFAVNYLDDMSKIDPILDIPLDTGKSRRTLVDEEGWLIPDQPLPEIVDPNIEFHDDETKAGALDLETISKSLGISVEVLKGCSSTVLVNHNVSNQTRMGKIRRFYCLMIAGNRNGLLGIGEGKSIEIDDCIKLARLNAYRNMVSIPRYENRTIYGDIEIKQGAVEMRIMSRPPGFGVRCSSYIFEMCRMVGIQDLAARVPRSRNPMNVCKTFLAALQRQKLPETIARGRGKKFVDVRNVYYGGQKDLRMFQN